MLRDAGHRVVGLDVAAGVETQVLGSVASKELVDRVFAEHAIEAVIHGGALHKPDIARYPKQAFVDVNVTGTLNLLEAAVAARCDRFVFTSTTSLMISAAIRAEERAAAVWIDETLAPLEPRNIYGVTKLAAEDLCRLFHLEHGLAVTVLRTGRFFPEDDDMAHTHTLSGPNTKANELLYRRLTVEDAAHAHVVALQRAPQLGFDLFVVSAPTPFAPQDVGELKRDAAAVIARLYPEAPELYARAGWQLPASIGRVYDASRSRRVLGFEYQTDFAAVLATLRTNAPLPFTHDPTYTSPKETSGALQ
jgi:nucleoside-diphosphate-sugar epimerase